MDNSVQSRWTVHRPMPRTAACNSTAHAVSASSPQTLSCTDPQKRVLVQVSTSTLCVQTSDEEQFRCVLTKHCIDDNLYHLGDLTVFESITYLLQLCQWEANPSA